MRRDTRSSSEAPEYAAACSTNSRRFSLKAAMRSSISSMFNGMPGMGHHLLGVRPHGPGPFRDPAQPPPRTIRWDGHCRARALTCVGGGGYTYFDPKSGWEFSAVAGLTYNFINPDLDYQNGIDAHLDWGISRFVSKQVQIGVVGYAYQQLTGDSGPGATLGDFES